MRRGRLVWHSFLICLPALALVALGIFFLHDKVPKLVAQQRRDETMAYRQTALRIVERPDEAEVFARKRKGWRQSGKIGGKGLQVAWGHVAEGERELVWAGNGKLVLGIVVNRVDAPDIATLFSWGVPIVLSMFFVLTMVCLRFFLRYAKERDDFVAATAHDLTTPIAALKRTIGMNAGDATLAVDRLDRLVGNLRLFLRSGGRRIVPKKERFDLMEAYAAAYAMLAEDFRDVFDGADVEVSSSGGAALVEADRAMTEQVIWNLLANAFKYAAPYGRVFVRVSSGGGKVRLEVCDEGPGLSAKDRRRIFRRYYRAKSALAGGVGGFGIGLCTARELARVMGGSLTVSKNHPHGCIFTFTLNGFMV